MDGEILRKKIKDTGIPIAEVARLIGQSRPNLSQSLSVKDVKTGLIEKIASALELPLSYFYGESTSEPHAIAHGTRAIAAVNSTISPEQSEKAVLEEKVKGMQKLLDEKDRTIRAYERLCTLKNQGPFPNGT